MLILHLQVLPVEYGGTGGSLAEITEFWVTEAVKQKDWFARFVPRCSCLIHNAVILFRAEKYKSEEEKRPGGKKTHSDLFGIEGSFRYSIISNSINKILNGFVFLPFIFRKLDID